MLARNSNLGDEIVQVALMRGCWFYAEEKFTLRIRAICHQWTDGDRKKANALCRYLLSGKTASVPSQLAFATMPLVNMLVGLRRGREHVDAAFKMAVVTDPAATEDIAAEVPDGYISQKEASDYMGVAAMRHLRGAALFIAFARAVQVLNGRRRKSPLFFAVGDLEMAKKATDEEQAERLTRRIARLARRRRMHAPLDAIPAKEVAARVGMRHLTLVHAAQERDDQEAAHFPTLYRFGYKWFSFEADIAAFLERQSRFEGLKQKGWLDTRAAATRIGSTQGTLIKECRQLGLEPQRLGHHVLYSPQDLENIRWVRESRAVQVAAKEREQSALRLALRQQRAKERLKQKDQAAIIIVEGTPEDGIPIRQALAQIGMKRKRFDKIKRGLSGTPIPRYHRAPNGYLYCKPDELAAFCSDPQAHRMPVVPR